MLLERGEQRLTGEPDRVGAHYIELNFGREVAPTGHEEPERYGSQAAEIVDAWFEDESGRRTEHLVQGSRCTVHIRTRFKERMLPNVALMIENEDHVPLFATSSADCGLAVPEHEPGDEWVFSVTFTMLFRPGRIWLSPWVVPIESYDPSDRRPRMVSAVITAVHDFGAIVNLPHEAEYAPAEPAVPAAKP
jgi:Wzt C-terminal domain